MLGIGKIEGDPTKLFHMPQDFSRPFRHLDLKRAPFFGDNPFRLPTLGDILDAQENALTVLQLRGAEQEDPPPQDGEIVLDLEIFENPFFGKNLFQRLPQSGDTPLSVTQFINQAILHLRLQRPGYPAAV